MIENDILLAEIDSQILKEKCDNIVTERESIYVHFMGLLSNFLIREKPVLLTASKEDSMLALTGRIKDGNLNSMQLILDPDFLIGNRNSKDVVPTIN